MRAADRAEDTCRRHGTRPRRGRSGRHAGRPSRGRAAAPDRGGRARSARRRRSRTRCRRASSDRAPSALPQCLHVGDARRRCRRIAGVRAEFLRAGAHGRRATAGTGLSSPISGLQRSDSRAPRRPCLAGRRRRLGSRAARRRGSSECAPAARHAGLARAAGDQEQHAARRAHVVGGCDGEPQRPRLAPRVVERHGERRARVAGETCARRCSGELRLAGRRDGCAAGGDARAATKTRTARCTIASCRRRESGDGGRT